MSSSPTTNPSNPEASSRSLLGSSLLSLFGVFVIGQLLLGSLYVAGLSPDLLLDAAFAGSCCLAAMLVGHIPFLMLLPAHIDRLPATIMAVSGLRMVVGCAMAIALIHSGTVDAEVTAFSFFAWYGVLLTVELLICTQQVRRLAADAFDKQSQRPLVQYTPRGCS